MNFEPTTEMISSKCIEFEIPMTSLFSKEMLHTNVTNSVTMLRIHFNLELSISDFCHAYCIECIPTWSSRLISVKNWLLFRNYGELESPVKSLFSKELLHTGMLQFQSPCIEWIPIWNSRSLVSVKNWFLFRSYGELESLMESLFSKIAPCKFYKFSHHA